MSHRECPPQLAGRGEQEAGANIASTPEQYRPCKECGRPLDDILDVFYWDEKPMHRACVKAVARRCLNQVANKRGMA